MQRDAPDADRGRLFARYEGFFSHTAAQGQAAEPAHAHAPAAPTHAPTYAPISIPHVVAAEPVGPMGDMMVGGWDQMRARLEGEGPDRPMLVTFETCRDSIRTIPTLQHDPNRAEDLDSNAEDHAADDWRYGCMSRPWIRPAPSMPKRKDDWAGNENDSDDVDWKAA